MRTPRTSAGSFLYARRGRDLLLESGATRQPDGKSAKTGFAESTWVMQRSRTEDAVLCAQTHRRACDAAHTGQRYLFLSAAFAGCPQCVRRYVEEGGAGHFTTALGAICHLAVGRVTLDTMWDMAQMWLLEGEVVVDFVRRLSNENPKNASRFISTWKKRQGHAAGARCHQAAGRQEREDRLCREHLGHAAVQDRARGPMRADVQEGVRRCPYRAAISVPVGGLCGLSTVFPAVRRGRRRRSLDNGVGRHLPPGSWWRDSCYNVGHGADVAPGRRGSSRLCQEAQK